VDQTREPRAELKILFVQFTDGASFGDPARAAQALSVRRVADPSHVFATNGKSDRAKSIRSANLFDFNVLRATSFISIFCRRTLIPLAGICNKTNILVGRYQKNV
jgi:hypothetical protein